MQGLFVRVYAGLVLVLLASVAFVAWLPGGPAGPPTLSAHVTHLTGMAPAELQARLADADDPGAVARELSAELGTEVALLPEDALVRTFSDAARRALASREPLAELKGSGPAVYVPIPGKQLVAALRPPPPPPPFDRRRALLFATFALLGAGGVGFALIRPVENQLEDLVDAAERIGQGDLEARAPVLRNDAAGRLAAAFNSMAEQVGSMVRGREKLMHGVSHELRTPLARLRFALELIEFADGPEGRSKRIREATADVDELEGLVRELLQYSKLQSGEASNIQTEPIDPAPVLEDLVDGAQRVRPAIELSFEQEGGDGEVPLDKKLFARAVGNLINNAVRYADEEVVVTMRLEARWLKVLVDDDGPGVPAEERERIFDPFSRLDDARSRDTGGTGLGLPIAAGAARAHGGRVEVNDSPLGGARFIWIMPL
ncbi:MAG: HAMP domain-containing protein [Deltaproteobacteria bacterium]|nr:HAMP domain-containing protein [Deltaproteobacteria bacterium]